MSRATVLLTPLGIVIKKGRTYDHLRFGEDSEECVHTYRDIKMGHLRDREKEFLEGADLDKVTTNSPAIASLMERNSLAGELDAKAFPEEEISRLIQRSSFVKERGKEWKLLQTLYLELARYGVKQQMKNWDNLVIQEVSALEECREITNKLYERLQEWYGLHFPEFARHVKSPNLFVEIVAMGRRNDITPPALRKAGVDDQQANRIRKAAEVSIGIDLEDDEVSLLKRETRIFMSLVDLAKSLETRIGETMSEMAPNLTSVAGSILSAKLVSRAGSMRKLAMLPASTVQVLGAEKALFRALRKGGKPPKHGIIFEHPIINQSPRVSRGRLARLLASKITLATRMDFFGGKDKAQELKENLDAKVEVILKQRGGRRR